MGKLVRKTGKMTFTRGRAMQFSEKSGTPMEDLTQEQERIVHQVSSTVKAYLDAAENLLKEKYAPMKDLAPVHLTDHGNVLVICCDEGILIRYERRQEEKKVMTAWRSEGLSQSARLLSESVVHCRAGKGDSTADPSSGPEVKLLKKDSATGEWAQVLGFRVSFEAVINQPSEPLAGPPNKPYCLLSVQNSLEIQMLGEMVENRAAQSAGKRFLVRTAIRLPVGWECIEIFPFFNVDHWRPEYAKIWAENDILASVVATQFREAQLQSLDPKATARKQFGNLLKQYQDLLDSNPEREEVLQTFLRQHPEMLCPTCVRFWSKLPLGVRETDFVFQEATGEYLLVELESPDHPLFLKNGDPSRQLNHARSQITDWRRYIEDNLATVQRELGLTGISTHPAGLVVIGRSTSVGQEDRRKLVTMVAESPTTRVITYDDLLVSTKAVVENLLGPLWSVTGNTEVYYLPENS
jgi:hypothetical protein